VAEAHSLAFGQARVHLAQGNPSTALAVLEPWRQLVQAKGWKDEQLKAMVLQAVALHGNGEKDKAMQVLSDVLALAEPGGFIRLFLDEGPPMQQLLLRLEADRGTHQYIQKLLVAFGKQEDTHPSSLRPRPLLEPLTPRELEVLQLIAEGLSNDEIGKRLFLALDTVKGHNRRIFDKLQVQRRTEAVARARELGLL
jgi:LuxR family maltose regulon positive regulatory protein